MRVLNFVDSLRPQDASLAAAVLALVNRAEENGSLVISGMVPYTELATENGFGLQVAALAGLSLLAMLFMVVAALVEMHPGLPVALCSAAMDGRLADRAEGLGAADLVHVGKARHDAQDIQRLGELFPAGVPPVERG